MRLGIADVYQFLEDTPREVLDFWIAFDAIEPIGDEWAQTASLRFGLANIEGWLASRVGVALDPPDFEGFMPRRYVREPVETPDQSQVDPNEQFAAFGRAFGFDEKELRAICDNN